MRTRNGDSGPMMRVSFEVASTKDERAGFEPEVRAVAKARLRWSMRRAVTRIDRRDKNRIN
jgi:hypothetical protein